ncbi:MAG TPA: biotin synthase BioB [Nitrospiria bacterium]|nr:biotin synthase BioB [Nitrospiria bacterium]
MNLKLKDIIRKQEEGAPLSRDEALSLVSIDDTPIISSLAENTRKKYKGDLADLCSVISAKSGSCPEDCSFCAQSAHYQTGIMEYPLIQVDKIIKAASDAKKNGARRFCISTSGRGIEDNDDISVICEAIGNIRDEVSISPCATLGMMSSDHLKALKEAGLNRYHHNLETSETFYKKICTTHSYSERVEMVKNIKDAGLSACVGGILGMGETMEDRADLAIAIRDLDPDSIPINFLMPIMGTPLDGIPRITHDEALRSIALFRFIMPDKEIRICGGRVSALGDSHRLIFNFGADGMMVGNYLTRSGVDPKEDLRMLNDLGLGIREIDVSGRDIQA